MPAAGARCWYGILRGAATAPARARSSPGPEAAAPPAAAGAAAADGGGAVGGGGRAALDLPEGLRDALPPVMARFGAACFAAAHGAAPREPALAPGLMSVLALLRADAPLLRPFLRSLARLPDAAGARSGGDCAGVEAVSPAPAGPNLAGRRDSSPDPAPSGPAGEAAEQHAAPVGHAGGLISGSAPGLGPNEAAQSVRAVAWVLAQLLEQGWLRPALLDAAAELEGAVGALAGAAARLGAATAGGSAAVAEVATMGSGVALLLGRPIHGA